MKKKILLSFMIVSGAAMVSVAALMAMITYKTFELRVAPDMSTQLMAEVFMRSLPLILLVIAGLLGICFAAANLLTQRILRPIEQIAAGQQDEHASAAHYPELEPLMSTIRSQHEEIIRSANMRVEFTANVSHELKTPLTAISGYAELIESGMAEGEQGRRFAGEIRKSTARLLTLINDTIQLSQLDSPEREPALEPVNLALLASGALEQLKIAAEKMNVTLRLDARTAIVSADRQMMEELVYNLCDNAIRYNVPGGSVRVQIIPLKEQVILRVQDTGIGISKEHQAHIFERFYRVDKSRSKATGGTGLGLAIVKHIAVKHGADIAIESEPGRGTSISVTFERCNIG